MKFFPITTVAIIFLLYRATNILEVNGVIEIDSLYSDSTFKTAPCVLKLCEKYFRSKKAVKGSLVIINVTPNGSRFQRRILTSLNENSRHELAVMVKDARKRHGNASHVTEKAKNYLMLLTNASELTLTIRQLRGLPTWNPLAQVIIFMAEDMDDLELEMQTKKIFIELFEASVLNVNVMSRRPNSNLIQVVTWYPYEYDNCADRITNLRLIDECEYVEIEEADLSGIESENSEVVSYQNDTANIPKKKSFVFRETHYHADLGPKTPDDFHGCPLKIFSAKWEPYIIFNPKDGFYNGIEYSMLKTLTDQMNLQPMFTLINQTIMNYLGNTKNEILFYSDLLNRTTDVMVGGLSEKALSRKFLSASIPYYQDDLTFCVAKAGLAPNFMNVFVIFSLTTWIVAILVLHGTGYLIWIFSKFDGSNHGNMIWGVLQSLAATLSTISHYKPKNFGIRLYFITLLFYGMHFNAAYHSFLISVLTRPRYKSQVNSIAHAVSEKFHFTGSENSLSYLNKGDDITRYIRERFKICEQIDVCLRRIKEDPTLAVAVSREHAKNSPFIDDRNMFCFDRTENIYSYSVVMLVKRDYHLLPKINEIIRRILESGLFTKWQKDSQILKLRSEQREPSSSASGHVGEQIVLSLDHVQGAFYIGAIGLICSVLAFITEWIYYWIAVKKKLKRFDKYIDVIFC